MKEREKTYHTAVPSVCISISIIGLDDTSIAGLEILSSRGLDLDDGLMGRRYSIAGADGSLSISIGHGWRSRRRSVVV
jgi:hypothetical protein